MEETKRYGNKKNPFTLPENYFEEFHGKLMQQLPQKDYALQPRNINLKSVRLTRWYAAAAVALILLVSSLALHHYATSNSHGTTEMADAARNEYIETIFDNYTIDDYNIYCYLTSTDANF